MAVAVRRTLTVERLTSKVLRLIQDGVATKDAVERVLSKSEIDPDSAHQLMRRGLMSYVDAELLKQRFGETTRVILAPADSSSESGTRRGGGELSSVRRIQQVAPGKPSEWAEFRAKYPTLSRIIYKDYNGLNRRLADFTARDWATLAERNETSARAAKKRAETARTARRLLRERKVERTRDLPAADLDHLEKVVDGAWQR